MDWRGITFAACHPSLFQFWTVIEELIRENKNFQWYEAREGESSKMREVWNCCYLRILQIFKAKSLKKRIGFRCVFVC